MAVSFEFLSIDLTAVKDSLAAGPASLAESIIAEWSPELFDDKDLDDLESCIIWREVLQEMLGGTLGRRLSNELPLGDPEQPTEKVSDTKALAVMTLLREFGRSCGGTTHTISDGELFRIEVPQEVARSMMMGNLNPELLWSRPLFGMTYDITPTWGGLTRLELAKLPHDIAPQNRWRTGDSDIDDWLRGIFEGLDEARYLSLDLVVLYE